MKTLLFTLEYPPFRGGIANYNENVVRFWPLRQAQGEPGNEIFVLNNNDGRLINNRLPVLKWLPAVFTLWRTVKKEKISHVLVSEILPLGTVAFLVSCLARVRYSVFIHGTDLGMAQAVPRKRKLAKIILNNCQAIICNSRFVAGSVASFIGPSDKIIAVNPGVDISRLAPPDREYFEKLKQKYGLENKLVLLTIGRLVHRKGIDLVLDSLPEALKEEPRLFYAVIGIGPELINLKSKILALGLKDRAIIISDAGDEERNAWLALADIFIMTPREVAGDPEGFGIVYLEASAAGKPIIASDTGGVGEAVETGVSGLLTKPDSVPDITAAIIKLAGDENLRKTLGKQGRERAIKSFDWKKQVQKITI